MTDAAEPSLEVRTVTLGGKALPVPTLAWLQLSKCRSELIELQARLNEAIGALAADPDEAPFARQVREMGVVGDVFDGLSNDDCDRLVMRPIHTALTALHPELGWDEFCKWPSTEAERQLAWLVVRGQSGLFVMREGTEPALGEDLGAA